VEGKLVDFSDYIECVQQPHGFDYKYYAIALILDGDIEGALAKWEDGEQIIQTFPTKQEADDALEQIYVEDILSNDYLNVFMTREDAERALQEITGGQL